MGTQRLAASLWPASALAFVLAAWLFLPRATEGPPRRAPLRVVLVDVSVSVSRAERWLPWVRSELGAEARAARAEAEELAVLAFADGVAVGFGPGTPEGFLQRLGGQGAAPFDPGLGLARGATRLAEALAVAEDWLADGARPAGRLTLLGPATYTGEDPSGALARLALRGVGLLQRSPPAPEAHDLGLLELALAPRVEAGAPLVARARLVWRQGTAPLPRASLLVEVECEGSVRALVRELVLPGVDGELEVPLDCGPAGFGRNEVRARCRLDAGPDLLPENDRARALTTAEGARVLGVAVRPELRGDAEAWLAPAGRSALAGLQAVFLAPEEVPAELPWLDALITFDFPPSALPAELLAAFVRDGGGWLSFSGYRFLDGWIPGEEGGALHALLPAEPARREAPPRDVVLLVDGSGSMDGEPFESVRAAALELVSAALPSDRVSLRFFTVRLEPEHLLKPRSATRREDQEAAKRAAGELLALRVPAGTTFLLHSLEELAGQAGEHERLVLLLTDGWEREGLPDPLGLAAEVRARLEAVGARLVVIAVGEPNLALLEPLAGGPERVRSGATLEDLRAVFHRELHGPRLAEGELPVHAAPRAPGSLASAIEERASGSALAPLERYVRNRLRPGGEALWLSEEGEPVLAVGRAGLGRVALFASRPGPGWASRYSRAGLGEPAEFESLLRWLARGREGSGSPGEAPCARLEDGWIRVTGLPPDTPSELGARLVDGDGAARELRLLPPAQGGAGVLRARETRWAGSLGPEAALLLQGGTLPITSALPQELAWREAQARVPEPPPAVGEGPPVAGRAAAHRLAPWVLGLAIALLFASGLSAARGQGIRGFVR